MNKTHVETTTNIECAKRIAEFFDSFGYDELVLKYDNESTINILRNEMIVKKTPPTKPTSPIAMHPQTHGRAEDAIQDIID